MMGAKRRKNSTSNTIVGAFIIYIIISFYFLLINESTHLFCPFFFAHSHTTTLAAVLLSIYSSLPDHHRPPGSSTAFNFLGFLLDCRHLFLLFIGIYICVYWSYILLQFPSGMGHTIKKKFSRVMFWFLISLSSFV